MSLDVHDLRGESLAKAVCAAAGWKLTNITRFLRLEDAMLLVGIMNADTSFPGVEMSFHRDPCRWVVGLYPRLDREELEGQSIEGEGAGTESLTFAICRLFVEWKHARGKDDLPG